MEKNFKLFLFLCAVFIVPGLCQAAGKIPDTGQTKCYNNSQVIPCPQPGQEFYGQDSQYTINPPSYTKLDVSGNDQPDSATTWAMVRDNVTGLIWENKTDDGSIHDKENASNTWYDPNTATNGGSAGTDGNGYNTKAFIDALNAENFGGHNDWRLPTAKELLSIVNYGFSSPSIHTAYFPDTISFVYWSSTSFVSNYPFPNCAWHMEFRRGKLAYSTKAGYSMIGTYYQPGAYYSVRAVHGGQSGLFDNSIIPTRMKDNGDETVTDTYTGLMWQKQDDGTELNWESALSYCANLSLAGYNDWRLPNAKELASITDLSKFNPATDPVFTNTMSSMYWSSTTTVDLQNNAWTVNFDGGEINLQEKSNSFNVRAVRDGYCGINAFVSRFYQFVLGRVAETEGLDYWTNSLMNKTRAGADVAWGFIFSQEFTNQNLDNVSYLNVLYSAFFNRLPDSEGHSYWLGRLNNSEGRDTVLSGFIYSQEFYNLCQDYSIKQAN